MYIYSVNSSGERTAEPIVVAASADVVLKYPCNACFVHRNGVDSLLICDFGEKRVVETTATGLFLRAISVDFRCFNIAYCGTRDVIAGYDDLNERVVLLRYDSGETVLTIKTTGTNMAINKKLVKGSHYILMG